MVRITKLVSLARHTHDDHHFVRKGLFSKGKYPLRQESTNSSKARSTLQHGRSSPITLEKRSLPGNGTKVFFLLPHGFFFDMVTTVRRQTLKNVGIFQATMLDLVI
jgi:hypothetical protein